MLIGAMMRALMSANPIKPKPRQSQKLDTNVVGAGLYFGGTAFKKQRPVDPKDYDVSAMLAANYMDVVTTSGTATGNAAEISKITTFRSALPDTPIALASGITPYNALDYKMVDCFMVATGINIDDDFYNIDSEKLNQLISQCKKMEGPD